MPTATRIALTSSIAVAVAATLIFAPRGSHQQSQCPPGYKPLGGAPGVCVTVKHPEPPFEWEWRQREILAVRAAPHGMVMPGAYAAAVAERDATAKRGKKVQGTGGIAQPYGRGPLIVNDANFPSVNGLGLVHVMGRIDDLAFDAASGRIFAVKGTGGIWQSEDHGSTWRSIGDSLPSQIVGAVAWTSAGGGTLLAVSGDPTFGGIAGYTGFGAFYSADLGQTWNKATGVPDGALSFAIKVDPINPDIVYAATMFGLFRSTDAGRSYVNVVLPTGPCAGVEGGIDTGRPECHLANVVTDVIIKEPGGVNSDPGIPAGTILAAVGWRGGTRKNADGTVQSPNNGLYRSSTGGPGTFVKVAASGFTPQERIGRIELGPATGALQDHDFVYAIVQDAVALNGGLEVIDGPDVVRDPRGGGGTNLHGIFVSSDFGQTWIQMADDNAIAKNPATGSALAVVGQALFFEPGIQAWYNEWILPDPTRQTLDGIPTRLVFGLEEVWQNEITSQPMNGPTTFKVIGRYFSDETCLLIGLGLPECPTNRPPTTSTTTHPDQHDGLWIPDGSGGVTLMAGGDGGFYKNRVAMGQELDNGGWGDGNQDGFNTLLPYDLAVAKDGIVWAGLQDNGHIRIDPDGRQFMTFGGDGTWAAVDPNNSSVAYEGTPFADMRVTIDGGTSWRGMAPPIANSRFVNAFEMDPSDANHLVTAGREVVETIFGPNTGLTADTDWKEVFDLGTASRPGDASATASSTDPANQMSAITVNGDAVYVGFCGLCDVLNARAPFKRGIATNVGGTQAPQRMTSNGWHIAGAAGLPSRFITSIAIDPSDARTIYVTLGGYSRRWVPPNTLQDTNPDAGVGHVFKSTDAGETFIDISGNLPDAPATWVTLRGPQVIVGTDVGVFASDSRGGTEYAPLAGLPVVPISTMQLAPHDPDLLFIATYGRGVYTFRFKQSLAGPPPADAPVPVACGAPAGEILGGPFGFEAGTDGWTVQTEGLPTTTWRLGSPGANSVFSFQVQPYFDLGNTALVSPPLTHPGGCAFVTWSSQRDTEPGFDFLTIEWSSDGERWNLVKLLDGTNASHPGFDREEVSFDAPGGPLFVRFRLISDLLISSPLFLGAAVDDVVIRR